MLIFTTEFSPDFDINSLVSEKIISIRKILDNHEETTYYEVTLDVDNDSDNIMLDGVNFIRYVHFSFILSLEDKIYSKGKSDLDCAILSAITKNKVTTTKIENVSDTIIGNNKIEFYLEGGTPFWINPKDWNLFTEYLSKNNSNDVLFSTNPLTLLITKLKNDTFITRFDNINVWKVSEDNYELVNYNVTELQEYFESTNTKIIDTNSMNEDYYIIFLEILELYKIKPFQYKDNVISNIDNYYFIFNDRVFTKDWILNALEDICVERKIPKVLLEFTQFEHEIENKVNQSYIQALKCSGSLYKFEKPRISYLGSTYYVNLRIDSKKVYDVFISNMNNKEKLNNKHRVFNLKPLDGVPYFKILSEDRNNIKIKTIIVFSNGYEEELHTKKISKEQKNKFKEEIILNWDNGRYLSDWSKSYQFLTQKNSNDKLINF